MCQKKVVILRTNRKRYKIMEAALRQPVMQTGTISEEKWNGLHSVEELDTALKTIIHNHFHG